MSCSGRAPDRIACVKDTFVFNAPETPAAYVADFRHYYGPTMNAFAAAEAVRAVAAPPGDGPDSGVGW